MWKMIAPPKRDNMFDFPRIPFVVALNQHLSSDFLLFRGLYTTWRLRKGLRKPTRPARGAYAITSQLPGAYLRGQTLSSSVEVHCGSSSWKIATFQCKCSFGSSGSKIRNAVQVRIQHLSKDLAGRKGLRTQNALKAYANTYAGPTQSLREDCRTNRRKAKEANSFIRGMGGQTPIYGRSFYWGTLLMDISGGDSCPPTALTILSHVGSRTLFSVCLQQLSQTHAHPYAL